MTISLLENIKNSIINNSSSAVWTAILDTYDDELQRMMADGDITILSDLIINDGTDELGLSAGQITAITTDVNNGVWVLNSGISGASTTNGTLYLSAGTGIITVTGFSTTMDTNVSGGSMSYASNAGTLQLSGATAGLVNITGIQNDYYSGGSYSNGTLQLSGTQGIASIAGFVTGNTNVSGGSFTTGGTLTLSGSENIFSVGGFAASGVSAQLDNGLSVGWDNLPFISKPNKTTIRGGVNPTVNINLDTDVLQFDRILTLVAGTGTINLTASTNTKRMVQVYNSASSNGPLTVNLNGGTQATLEAGQGYLVGAYEANGTQSYATGSFPLPNITIDSTIIPAWASGTTYGQNSQFTSSSATLADGVTYIYANLSTSALTSGSIFDTNEEGRYTRLGPALVSAPLQAKYYVDVNNTTANSLGKTWVDVAGTFPTSASSGELAAVAVAGTPTINGGSTAVAAGDVWEFSNNTWWKIVDGSGGSNDASVTGGSMSYASNAGTLQLSGAQGLVNITGITDNYYSGGSYSNGTLQLSGTQGIASIVGFVTGNTNVSGGNLTNGTLQLSGSEGLVNITGFVTGNTNVSGGNVTNGTLTLSGSEGISTITGFSTTVDTNVTGGSMSYASNAGTLQLSGATAGLVNITGIQNDYVSGASYSNGTIQLSGTQGIVNITGLVTGDTNVSGGSVTYASNAGTLQLSGSQGLVNITGLQDNYISGASYNAGTLQLSGTQGIISVANFDFPDDFVSGGSMSYAANSGTLQLSGSQGLVNVTGILNDYVSGGSVNSGTLTLSGSQGLSTITGFSTTVDTNVTGGSMSYASNAGTLQLSGATAGIVNITGIQNDYVSGGSYNAGQLQLSGTQGIVNVTGFDFPDDFITGGSMSYAANNGTLQLSGGGGLVNVSGILNDYVSGGSYSNGTIQLSGSQGISNITGLVTGDTNVSGGSVVISSGTLSLSGAAAGVVTVTGFTETHFVRQQGIVIHNNGTANAKSTVVSASVPISSAGDYLLTLSFNYNVDTNTSDLVAYSTFDGNAIDLNDRNADPQGQFQILRAEVKDNANGPGGAITGTGSGQKYNYSMQFYLDGITAGAKTFLLEVGSEAANTEASVWNVIARFDKVV